MNDLGNRSPLEPLDPGYRDPGFWIRYHARVMDQARDELARRRMEGDLSVAEVVFAWRRTLVPTALLAAALAGILLMSQQAPVVEPASVALEDALVQDMPGGPIPSVLGRDTELDEVAFVSTVGGF